MDRITLEHWLANTRGSIAVVAEVMNHISRQDDRISELEETVKLLSQVINHIMEER